MSVVIIDGWGRHKLNSINNQMRLAPLLQVLIVPAPMIIMAGDEKGKKEKKEGY